MEAYLKEVSEKEFEENLTDIYGEVEICGMKFESGRALKEIDPIAFRCAMNDEPEIWVCDECKTEFETEEEANDCCQ
jgi:hypothetical protein